MRYVVLEWDEALDAGQMEQPKDWKNYPSLGRATAEAISISRRGNYAEVWSSLRRDEPHSLIEAYGD